MLVYLITVHYHDVTMNAIASQITSLTIVYSTVYSGADQRKHQSSVSLAFVRGIHRGPVNSPHKWPATRKMFPFDDVIMSWINTTNKNLDMTYIWIRHKEPNPNQAHAGSFYSIPNPLQWHCMRLIASHVTGNSNVSSHIFQANIKENITGQRWIPHTKVQ